ncbi:cytochrome C [Sulfuricurvum sp. IAE1]|jgi:mono/diheme cytochrome c family protein|uniref:cytochrome c n=1 Tax=Sulfuricurvum sp. IAE1 TaxID=2546102 RepID=UPI001048CB2A|nr:cytochrome c [Sulfuricurvum sp. IAE1]MDD3770781.1 cytochrome c [Sulfuricurvum sp.]MDX9966436.1 cytochrome c [Sulfuricurvum sp.]TDA69083.1 cytochrome C [Sulfuricurvum sp. IAE1]
MRTLYATVALTLLAGSTLLSAATYKGQKIYIESCKECHGGGQELAASKKQRAWEKLMNAKGQKLADIHLGSKKAQASWEYFGSRAFTKNAKHLEDFLVEYAADSGNVPACN